MALSGDTGSERCAKGVLVQKLLQFLSDNDNQLLQASTSVANTTHVLVAGMVGSRTEGDDLYQGSEGLALLLRIQLRGVAGGIDGCAEVLAAIREEAADQELVVQRYVATCLARTTAQEEVVAKIGIGQLLGWVLSLSPDDQQICTCLATAIHNAVKYRLDELLDKHEGVLIRSVLLLCRDKQNVDVLYQATGLILTLADKLDLSILVSQGGITALSEMCKAESAASKDTRENCAKLFLVLSQKSFERQLVEEGVAETLCTLLLAGIGRMYVAETLALCSLKDTTWELFSMVEIESIAKYCSKTASKVRLAYSFPST
jgi:hypothetical protein